MPGFQKVQDFFNWPINYVLGNLRPLFIKELNYREIKKLISEIIARRLKKKFNGELCMSKELEA